MRRLLVAAILAAACTGAPAGIYKWVLPDGEIVYSDRAPAEGAKQIELSPLQTYTPAPYEPIVPSTGGDQPPGGDGGAGYEEFVVSRPANDESLRDNGGSVSIALKINPALRAGHVIDIFMDGERLGSGASTSITVTNVDRGSHTVRATVKDDTGAEVASTPAVTFHLKRAALGSSPPPPPPKPPKP